MNFILIYLEFPEVPEGQEVQAFHSCSQAPRAFLSSLLVQGVHQVRMVLKIEKKMKNKSLKISILVNLAVPEVQVMRRILKQISFFFNFATFGFKFKFLPPPPGSPGGPGGPLEPGWPLPPAGAGGQVVQDTTGGGLASGGAGCPGGPLNEN